MYYFVLTLNSYNNSSIVMRPFICLILICCAYITQAQSTINARFDSAMVETGEPFMLRVEVVGGEPDTLDLSAWQALLPPENILTRSGWRKDQNSWRNDVQFIAFEANDTMVLPPLTVVLRDGTSLQSDSLRIQIIATPVPSTDLNDIADVKDIHREASNWTDYIWVGWILGGLAILALLLYWISKRKKQKNTLFRSQQLSGFDLAMRKLEQLEQQQLWQKGEVKSYYTALSAIMRAYIDDRYQTKTHKSGAEDAVAQIKKIGLDDAQEAALTLLLRNADLAKYAKGKPEAEYHPQSMADARMVVVGTRL